MHGDEETLPSKVRKTLLALRAEGSVPERVRVAVRVARAEPAQGEFPMETILLAVTLLEEYPLCTADYFPGDMLEALLSLKRSLLLADEPLLRRIRELAEEAQQWLPLRPEGAYRSVNERMSRCIDEFLREFAWLRE